MSDSQRSPRTGWLSVAAYAAGAETVAYVESVAVGDFLPDMPVFLTADRYVLCPLETTYQTAWEQYPAPLKEFLAAKNKDFPVLQAGVLVVGIVYLAATLAADILYSLLNPHIRHGVAE